MAQSLNDSIIVDIGVLEADHLQQENKALKNRMKEMEREKKQSEATHLAKTLDFEHQFNKMYEMLESLMASRAHSTPRETQSSLRIPLAGPDVNDKISVQVEHLVCGDSNRIRTFSGNQARQNENSFDEWAKEIELMLEDEGLSQRAKRQKLLGTLRSLALDIARGMGDISIYALFKNLGELYAPSTSCVRILQDFFRMTLKPGEGLIDYLQRLSVTLDKVVKRGGLQSDLVDDTLLSHFKTTCADDRVAHVLHVRFGAGTPPSLQQIVREVRRTEEDFASVPPKRDSNKKVQVQQRNVEVVDPKIEQMQSQIDMLSKQIQLLSSQSAAMACQQPSAVPTSNNSSQPQKKPTNKKWICLHCGKDDGHRRENCNNQPNPQLVHDVLNRRPRQNQNHLN